MTGLPLVEPHTDAEFAVVEFRINVTFFVVIDYDDTYDYLVAWVVVDQPSELDEIEKNNKKIAS